MPGAASAVFVASVQQVGKLGWQVGRGQPAQLPVRVGLQDRGDDVGGKAPHVLAHRGQHIRHRDAADERFEYAVLQRLVQAAVGEVGDDADVMGDPAVAVAYRVGADAGPERDAAAGAGQQFDIEGLAGFAQAAHAGGDFRAAAAAEQDFIRPPAQDFVQREVEHAGEAAVGVGDPGPRIADHDGVA